MIDNLIAFTGDLPTWVLGVAGIVLLFLLALLYAAATRRRPAPAQTKTSEPTPQATKRTAAPPPAGAAAPSPTAAAPEPTAQPMEAARPSFEASQHGTGADRGLGPLSYEAADKPYVTVTVHFGTDRSDTGPDAEPNDRFADKRATPEPGASPITYGTCNVAIPETHQVGRLEEPGWFEAEEPDKHVMILSLDKQNPDEFFTTLADRLTDLQQCFIFVHGFNVSFKNAARRTAQIAYDLRFNGAPIFYSWPTTVVGLSSISPTAYTEAENNAIWARYHFADLLLDVIRRGKPEVLHLAAHSMGNRIVTEALIDVAPRLSEDERTILREVVLTAPDIDAETFKTHIAPRLIDVVPRVSLYASDNDAALGLSESLHHLPCIGATSAAIPMPVPGIEVIDASDANTDYFGHSYYGEAEAIIADIFLATRSSKSAQERTVTLVADGDTHWNVRNEATVEAAWNSITAV